MRACIIIHILYLALLSGCGWFSKKNVQENPGSDPRIQQVRNVLAVRMNTAKTIASSKNGWLMDQDGDAMLWNGLYCSEGGGDDIDAAEYPDQPGRFARNPNFPCSGPNGTNCNATSWSRDQFMGLLACLWKTKKLAVLQRHATYGSAHLWKMGDPLDDGRVLYNPGNIGLLRNAINALGGPSSIEQSWEQIYPSGNTDYQAHLEMLGIWLSGEIAKALNDMNDVPKKPAGFHAIDSTMYSVIEEQFNRTPTNAFFATLHGIYNGDYGPALDLCSSDQLPGADYVRCDDQMACQLAYAIHACGLLSEQFP